MRYTACHERLTEKNSESPSGVDYLTIDTLAYDYKLADPSKIMRNVSNAFSL